MQHRVLRNYRNYFAVTVVSVSGLLGAGAPHFAGQPLAEVASAAAGELGSALNATGVSHLGFDTNIYPGNRAMDAWRKSGEYEWVGYYLSAPCHSDDSWSGTRSKLARDGWGMAVIYVGQQTWGKKYGPVTRTERVRVPVKKKNGKRGYVTKYQKRTTSIPSQTSQIGDCGAAYVNSSQGRIDAKDAIATTVREGFPKGTVIFLDVEFMETIPQRMRDYYRTWAKEMLADGRYRPGIYAHTQNATTIYNDVSDVYAAAGIIGEPPFWIAAPGPTFSEAAAPTDVGHAFATVWQGAIDVVRSHNGFRLPVDINVSSVPSPSIAE